LEFVEFFAGILFGAGIVLPLQCKPPATYTLNNSKWYCIFGY
jgi:hypothetical protein